MFILNQIEFANNDNENIIEFIEFWNRFYRNDTLKVINRTGQETEERIDYIKELNIDHNITEQNITRLLRWKLHRGYTHPHINPSKKGEDNTKVVTILNSIQAFHNFRSEDRSEESERRFANIAKTLIRSDSTMRIFLFHICRPLDYPIADTNVFRVCYRLIQNQRNDKVTWKIYKENYISFFRGIASIYCDNGNYQNKQYLEKLKEIDNALMMFGQFLRDYDSE